MKNQGISLITLIITIIVIIILAAIVIFTGLGTPDSAQFAHFCQDVDNVQSVVLNSFADLKAAHATTDDTRTDEQIYKELATGGGADGKQVNQYNHMTYDQDTDFTGSGTGENAFSATVADDACQHIVSGNSKIGGYKLPDVRESNNGWYVTANGQVFNATGYVYKADGKTYTYFNANARADTTASADRLVANGTKFVDRAKVIAKVLNTGLDASSKIVSNAGTLAISD